MTNQDNLMIVIISSYNHAVYVEHGSVSTHPGDPALQTLESLLKPIGWSERSENPNTTPRTFHAEMLGFVALTPTYVLQQENRTRVFVAILA
jgi:hypothetical protein